MESTPTIRAVPSAGAIIQTPAQSQLLLQSQLSKKQKTSTPQGCLPLSTRYLGVGNKPTLQHDREHDHENYSSDEICELLERIQDEIRRLGSLAQSDIYDAQLLQMLVKFRAEMLLVRMQKAHCKVVEVSCKRVTEEGSGDMETNSLLRQRLVKEIALLEVQAARERLELERERIKHKTTSILCRKRLLALMLPRPTWTSCSLITNNAFTLRKTNPANHFTEQAKSTVGRRHRFHASVVTSPRC
ncbi:hypothetical protein KRP22_015237 [Phytophthora ramorum]|nr:hypothetical protein KRP22_15169 [Phytophthora ramorum]